MKYSSKKIAEIWAKMLAMLHKSVFMLVATDVLGSVVSCKVGQYFHILEVAFFVWLFFLCVCVCVGGGY